MSESYDLSLGRIQGHSVPLQRGTCRSVYGVSSVYAIEEQPRQLGSLGKTELGGGVFPRRGCSIYVVIRPEGAARVGCSQSNGTGILQHGRYSENEQLETSHSSFSCSLGIDPEREFVRRFDQVAMRYALTGLL